LAPWCQANVSQPANIAGALAVYRAAEASGAACGRGEILHYFEAHLNHGHEYHLRDAVPQTGLQFNPRSAQGKVIGSLMAPLAEFERDLLRSESVPALRGSQAGRCLRPAPGQRVKADRFAPKALKLVTEGQSDREISHRLGVCKNTVLDIEKRDRTYSIPGGEGG
jgi:hypothetical protein